MTPTATLLWSYVDDDRAATAIEYVLIASFLSIMIAPAALTIGDSLQDYFQKVSDSF